MNQWDWDNSLSTLSANSGSWGDRDKIDRSLVLELDKFATDYQLKVLVTCGTQGEHVEKSQHYEGLAVDFMLPDFRLRQLPDLLINLLRYKFTGVGIYSEWRLNKQIANTQMGGFHVDVRPQTTKSLWLKGTNGYEALNMENLEKYFL